MEPPMDADEQELESDRLSSTTWRGRPGRILRIAWSVACGVVCLLLVALWMRSYWYWDMVAKGWGTTPLQVVLFSSQSGALVIHYEDARGGFPNQFVRWKVTTIPSPGANFLPIGGIEGSYAGSFYSHGATGFLLAIPYWFQIPLIIAIGVAPWIRLRQRFSLRALLIGMTIFALGLGLVVYSLRQSFP
jgi:hypothetical protein